jgi:bifunctional enzyme CysN/CysC
MGTSVVPAQVSELKYRVNVNTLEHQAAKTLGLNEIGVCNVALGKAVSFDPYAENPATGCFIMIDRFTNVTVGAGMIDFPLRRAANIHWQALDVHKESRAAQKGQKPCVLWFTGLSGAGKSTLANLVEKKLHSLGKHTYILDGENVRHALNKDLGFTDADRVENIRRAAEVARILVDAGLIVLVAFISPFRSERRMARELVGDGEFFEIYVDAPLEVCEQRDPKGLYRKARAGQVTNFTGIDSAYEIPEAPEMTVDTVARPAAELAEQIVRVVLGEEYRGELPDGSL